MTKQYYVYCLANSKNRVTHIGVTSNLVRRIHDHRAMLRAQVHTKSATIKLIYYEMVENLYAAQDREKELKSFRWTKKHSLINAFNPKWADLWPNLIQDMEEPSLA